MLHYNKKKNKQTNKNKTKQNLAFVRIYLIIGLAYVFINWKAWYSISLT